MYRTIYIAYSTLDGIIEDPDGNGGTPNGGWVYRHGPEPLEGDKFKLGPLFDTGALLLGRKTWQLFSQIWPQRTDAFSTRMNTVPKLVASRSLTDLSAWQNSSLLTGDLVQEITQRKTQHDVIVTGSASVVHPLVEQDLVDEYRIIVLPELVGRGTKLFTADTAPVGLRLLATATVGQGILMRYERAAA